ncbi:MAG: type II toxin-antitoxin system death-on-curing family toxin [Phenylobacterium sp.]|nr:type II toxin-antitoxin system death-on-curing family toxin [Phenylobacterium sp.]
MAEPVWLDQVLVLALYEDVVAASGGASGVRDDGLLESALARPLNRFLYEGVSDLLELAATYAVGIARNHPFIDGNKRMAFIALGQFLLDNRVVLTASDEDATAVMMSVAKGDTDIAGLTNWLEATTERF